MNKKLTSVDIGRKIRALRHHAGFTQEKLAELVGVSFQQIQKYENGSTKLNTEKLQDVASALKVPVSAFFEENVLEKPPLSEQEQKLIILFRGIKDDEIKDSFVRILGAIDKVAF